MKRKKVKCVQIFLCARFPVRCADFPVRATCEITSVHRVKMHIAMLERMMMSAALMRTKDAQHAC